MSRARTPDLTSDRFIYMLENISDHNSPQSYSGRAMYGERCVALIIESINDLAVLGAKLMIDADDDDERERIVEVLRDTRTDTMGKSEIIVYWPKLTWRGDDDDEA